VTPDRIQVIQARWRMTPDVDDVAALAEHFALKETTSAPGSVLAAYLADVVAATSELHAATCRDRCCHTCAGLATALLGVAAHHRLHGHLAGEEQPP
jgi:hypothetical protein